MKIFPELFKELQRPDDQGRSWYAWATNQLAHAALGFFCAHWIGIIAVLVFATGKEAFDLYKGGNPIDSLVDLIFWSIGALFTSTPGVITVLLLILLLAGVIKRFKAARNG